MNQDDLNLAMEPTALHDILEGQLEWVESVWQDAAIFVAQNVSLDDARVMFRIISADSVAHLTKNECIRDFWFYPPTLLLGVYDTVRWHNILRERMSAAELM